MMTVLNNSNEQVTMSSLEMVEYINSVRSADEAEVRHSNFLAKVPNVLKGDELKFQSVYIGGNGQERPCYKFPKREACLMAMSYSYELQAKVYDRMTELEGNLQKPKTPLELAREQVALYEALEEKEKELQIAIATKAQIGARREATAMNTASQAIKKANALEIQLDQSKEWATVKRVNKLYPNTKIDWRPLKTAGKFLSIEPIDVFDQTYGTVKSYHKDVWYMAYKLTF